MHPQCLPNAVFAQISASAVGVNLWFAHDVLPNFFFSPLHFSLSHPPAAIAPSKPHASWSILPATNSPPSLFPGSFPPALLRATGAVMLPLLLGEVLYCFGLLVCNLKLFAWPRTKVRHWFGLCSLLWNITGISVLSIYLAALHEKPVNDL